MSPRPENERWGTDYHSTHGAQVPLEAISTKWSKRTIFGVQIKQMARRLFQALPRGNERPKLGQMCLVMKGEAGCDEGQMAIVSERTPAMVRITYMGDQSGLTKTKLKRPSSLIMLDPRVTMMQDSDGSTWIRPCSDCIV